MVWHALATCDAGGGHYAPALVLDGKAYDLEPLFAAHPSPALQAVAARGLLSEFGNWPAIASELARIAGQAQAGTLKLGPVAPSRLVQPFTPHRIFATASNFIEHANEMGTVLAAKAESAPYVFMKASTSVVGPDAPIVLPAVSKQVDWEVELAAVIGQGGRNIPLDRALDHVAAYTIMNDISARDMTRRNDYPFKFDWFRGKSFDTFGPFGPWLVPAALIDDPQKLKLRLEVNGKTMQDDSTAAMIFTVAEQIAYLSSILTLQPGDVIATGTPNGVGMGTNTYLKPGDDVVASIERIGSLRNPVIQS
ncbi:fumarylacetoacetate hydrolase family protein [Rhodoplanes sp. Z2-YC6860]|uniref:fumarylacetoacetate hydrolase family protein n=1 Tax=Rhodoplanes sp. Z2-YC6860 TaxID=674703 RepID=UPI00078CE226|nr:fumarylacetoacetate hydrolase family protein [Rhodoplanes sp. Z2-YC6860]AMN44364.1 5-oxopent-3-ene-1,2,5-tricarboxylate decarboxylase [Rhodoplanes sp. Z2-YC6860]